MREVIFKVRRNPGNLSSIDDFIHWKGNGSNSSREVYFLRMKGMDAGRLREVARMDQALAEEMRAGKGFYYRGNQLPRLSAREEADYYSGCYENWQNARGQGIGIRSIAPGSPLAQILGNACSEVLSLWGQGKAGLSASIEKNFAVKLLFWLDQTAAEALHGWKAEHSRKAVFGNICKKQEYLFCYLLTLLGFDVLLLQAGQDIDAELERLGLSRLVGAVLASQHPLPDDIPSPCWHSQAAERANPVRGDTRRNPSPTWGNAMGGQNPARGNAMGGQNPARGNVEKKAKSGKAPAIVDVRIPERDRRTQEMLRASQQSASPRPTGAQQSASPRPTGAQRSASPRPTGAQRSASPRPTGIQWSVHSGPAGAQRGASPRPTVPPQRQNNTSQPAGIWQSGSRQQAMAGNAARQELSYEQLAQLASSVVMIMIHDTKGKPIGSGSGIMIGRDGYILTNNHVASGGRHYSVRIEEDEQVYQTDEMIKYNSVLDLAVLRIQRKLDPIPIYHGREKLVRGQKVVAIGSPLGLFNSVSDGIISGFRVIDGVDMIQFTAPISHGSSGGAVLNLYGEVIGISTAGIDSGQNINLAVGYEYIRTFVQGFQ